MRPRLLFFLVLFSISAQAQNWSTFLDSSRAIDWSTAGFTIPNYTANCSNQPSLTAGSGSASANAASINAAIASCDTSHNVVNIPSGTWYSSNIRMVKSNVVLRGAGPNSTTLVLTSGCNGSEDAGICMEDLNDPMHAYNGSASVVSGAQQCSWSAGYAQGTTTITLSNCGGAPLANHMLILDQADDTADTNGVYVCQANATSNCGYEAPSGGSGNVPGRTINGKAHSQQQVTYATSVTSLGGGSYSVTISSPGVYFSNIRAGQSPGAWWGGQIQNVGLEDVNITAKNPSGGYGSASYNVNMYDCYHCWMKNVVSQWAKRGHVMWMQAGFDQIRDSYFYQSQDHASQSYVIEFESASANLVENNIFQQVTNPMMFGSGSGNVMGYNYSVNDLFANPNYLFGPFSVHNAGSEMNLWEGNNFLSIEADDAFGSSAQQTYFRNQLRGWQSGAVLSTWAIMNRSNNRIWNVIGNVLGQPGYHRQYEAKATSSGSGTGGANEDTSIYSLGWGNTGAACSPISCDQLVATTMMRWGNWDAVNNAARWDSAEASPAAVPYAKANFTASYFSSQAHTLPASLYYSSKPSWWPTATNWPPIGPDVSTGNLGTCSGIYSGAQATNSNQCSGGTLTSSWASHATSIPAQDCYLSTMNGPPDGSGSVLSFDASQCYQPSGSGNTPTAPTGLTAAVN